MVKQFVKDVLLRTQSTPFFSQRIRPLTFLNLKKLILHNTTVQIMLT